MNARRMPELASHLAISGAFQVQKDYYCGKTNLGALIAHQRPCNDILDMKEAIYKIPCKECEVVYLGETKRKLGTRTKEHFASCQKAFLSQAVHQRIKNDTGLLDHFLHSGHSFDFDKVQLVQ